MCLVVYIFHLDFIVWLLKPIRIKNNLEII